MSIDESKIFDLPPSKRKPHINPFSIQVMRMIIYLSFAGILMGILFKVQHWKNASELMIIFSVTLTISGVLRYALRKDKRLDDYLLMGVFAFLPAGYLFTVSHWVYGDTLMLLGLVSLFAYIVHYTWTGLFLIFRKK